MQWWFNMKCVGIPCKQNTYTSVVFLWCWCLTCRLVTWGYREIWRMKTTTFLMVATWKIPVMYCLPRPPCRLSQRDLSAHDPRSAGNYTHLLTVGKCNVCNRVIDSRLHQMSPDSELLFYASM